ncbi:MAG: VOC family protein [Candidatus Dormibacteraeota bacterium]|nr:VOC family protein [Candidatus Dormibacteraeota bacterium]
MPRLQGLLELVLEVQDVDRSLAFYRDVLGLAVVERWPPERPGAWVRLGRNAVLGLWTSRSGGQGVGLHGGRGGRHVHYAIYAEPGSLAAWSERLAQAGYEVEGPVHFRHGSSIFVTDPDRHVLELGDWPRDWEGQPVQKRA